MEGVGCHVLCRLSARDAFYGDTCVSLNDLTLSATSRDIGAITALSCDKLGIFKSFSDDAAKYLRESSSVTLFALVESERLFIAVPEQMERLDVYIGAFKGAFQSDQKFSSPFVCTCPRA